MIRQLLKKQTGYSFEPECKFCKTRKWRFDYANFDLKVAVEVEGGAFSNGRHTRGKWFINDMKILYVWIYLEVLGVQWQRVNS